MLVFYPFSLQKARVTAQSSHIACTSRHLIYFLCFKKHTFAYEKVSTLPKPSAETEVITYLTERDYGWDGTSQQLLYGALFFSVMKKMNA